MPAHKSLLLTALLGGCALAPPEEARRAPADDAPNIVLIYADDLGYKDLGCYGHPVHQTPCIDALAASGLRFTQAYANAPNCLPSRACLMTGLYTPRHGVYTVGSSSRDGQIRRRLVPVANRTTLRSDIPTIPSVLRSAGYRTAIIGKWHLSDDPKRHGFDQNIGGNRLGRPPSYFSPYHNPDLPDGPDGEYLTRRLTDEAIRFLESQQDRRFFLFLSHFAVHVPIETEAEARQAFQPGLDEKSAGYAAMVQSLDTSVGRVMDALDRLRLRDNTLVIFTSDNGGNSAYTSMAPLRGAKGSLLEGGLRQPMIVRWPGRVATGRSEATPVLATDLLPSLARVARARVPASHPLDGVDLTPLFTGSGKLLPRPLFWHFPVYIQASPNTPETWRATPSTVMRMGDYKLCELFEYRRFLLFDLRVDESETDNLADRYPDLVRHLHARMLRWRHQIGAPLPAIR